MGRKSKNSKNRGADTGRAEEEDEDEEFTVDKILDKKTEDGQVKYLIHWEGYDESYDTWEPLEILLETCLETVEEFDKKFNAKNEADKENKRKRKRGGKPQPMTIIGATDEYPNKEGLQFLVKLSNGEKDLISREEMHRLYPHILIDFYESNVKWQEASK